MLKSNIKRNISIVALAFACLMLLTYFGLRIWFKSDISLICENAKSQYEGDKVEALIHLLESDIQMLDDKNHAIWALGKLQDKRALPILYSLQTEEECDHRQMVCQREVEKAISTLEEESIDILKFK